MELYPGVKVVMGGGVVCVIVVRGRMGGVLGMGRVSMG